MSPSASPSPSPNGLPGPSSNSGVIMALLGALFQTGGVIFIGYLARYFDFIGADDMRGVKKFCGRVALPAIFFYEVANIRWNELDWGILLGMFAAKVVIFIVAALYTLARRQWAGPSKFLGTMGLFCIFATKSNDIALGVPVVQAIWPERNFAKYLYLFAPFQLMVLNVLGFVLMELEIARENQRPASKSQPMLSVLVEGGGHAGGVGASSHRSGTPQSSTDSSEAAAATDHSSSKTNSPSLLPPSASIDSSQSPQGISLSKVLPRVIWNVVTTPPVLSVICGLLVNLVVCLVNSISASGSSHLTPASAPAPAPVPAPASWLQEHVLASEGGTSTTTLLPPILQSMLELIGNGYAVTALFSIGTGLFGSFQKRVQPVPGSAGTIDGIVLIALKTICMALATNFFVSLFTDADTDSRNFGWLYGLIPVAPTVYIFAEMYGIHQSFMALHANLCLFVAGPLMLVAGILAELTEHKVPAAVSRVQLDIATSLAVLSIVCVLATLVGFATARVRLDAPFDFVLVMACSCMVYCVVTLACRSSGCHGATPDVLVLSTGFFFETLYYTHACAMVVHSCFASPAPGTVKKCSGWHFATHIASLFVTVVATIVVGTTSYDSIIDCSLDMQHASGTARAVSATIQLLSAVVAAIAIVSSRGKQKQASSKLDNARPLLSNEMCRWSPPAEEWRTVALAGAALFGALLRASTTFLHLGDERASATVELSLMATAVTFMQGLVLLIIFGLHPRVVYVVRSRITSCIWWSQPEAELRSAVDRLRVMEQLVSADVTNSPVFNHGPSRSSYGTTSLRVEVGGATADAQVDAMRAMTMPLRVPVGGDIGGPGRAMPDLLEVPESANSAAIGGATSGLATLRRRYLRGRRFVSTAQPSWVYADQRSISVRIGSPGPGVACTASPQLIPGPAMEYSPGTETVTVDDRDLMVYRMRPSDDPF